MQIMRVLFKHRLFFRSLNHDLKYLSNGTVAVRVMVVTEEPPLLILDCIGNPHYPANAMWQRYLRTGNLPC